MSEEEFTKCKKCNKSLTFNETYPWFNGDLLCEKHFNERIESLQKDYLNRQQKIQVIDETDEEKPKVLSKKLKIYVFDTCVICKKKFRIYFECEQDKIEFEIDRSNCNLEPFVCPNCVGVKQK